ncbi:hypothetical protein [Amycolatopsis thermalba]|uniref:hypothetical protein n=1 Tax=Amycolatopsis thermalba TaxID=944492 RepID=UPI000E26D9CA|nr:hypothetical protein [Amycolatopsis thermalba]
MPHFVPGIGHGAAMQIIRGLGLVFAVPIALVVAGAVGWLARREGIYLAALLTGAGLTPVRVLPAALATAVLVVVGLLPLWIR